MQRNNKSTICWECTHAWAKGCSWHRSLEPVPGWVAEETLIPKGGGVQGVFVTLYRVISCPEYVAGRAPRVAV